MINIKLIESVDYPSLSMKTVNKNTATVVNSSPTLATATSANMIHFQVTLSGSPFDGIHKLRLRFRQNGSTTDAANIIESTAGYINGTWYKPLDVVVENGVTYREVDITDAFCEGEQTKYFSIVTSSTISLYTSTSNYVPSLMVCKIEDNDLLKHQIYLEGSIKNDLYKVNIRNSKLFYSKELLSVKSKHSMITLAMSYNIKSPSSNTLRTGVYTGLGKGFKFNYQQMVYASGNDYIYVDADYCKHVFKLAYNLTTSSSTKVYYDSSGSYSVLYVTSTGFKIENDGITLTFNSTGMLTQISKMITSACTYTETISLDSNNRVTKISDGTNYISISYTSTLVTIQSNDGRIVKINMNSDTLIDSIIDELNTTLLYTYKKVSSASLLSARDISTRKVDPSLYYLEEIQYGKYKVKFDYSSAMKILSITNSYNNNNTKIEALTVKGNKSNVKTKNYIDTSYLSTEFEYQFDDNAAIKSSYELINGGVFGLTHYTYDTDKNEMISFDSGSEHVINDFNVSSSGTTSLSINDVVPGDYILNVGCKVTGLTPNNTVGLLNSTVKVGKDVQGEMYFDPLEEGYQFRTVDVKVTGNSSSYTVDFPITHSVSGKTIIFTSIVLTPKPKQQSKLCTNIPGSSLVQQINSVNYYEDLITGIVYNDGSSKTLNNVDVSINDILQTQRSYYRETNKLVWFNNGEGMLYNSSSTSYKNSSSSLSISSIALGMISESEVICIGGKKGKVYNLQKPYYTSTNLYIDDINRINVDSLNHIKETGNRKIYDKYGNLQSSLEILLASGEVPLKEEYTYINSTGRLSSSQISKGSNYIIANNYTFNENGILTYTFDGVNAKNIFSNGLGSLLYEVVNGNKFAENTYLGDLKTLKTHYVTADGVLSKNTIDYDTSGDVDKMKTENTQYDYELDSCGRLSKVYLRNASSSLITTLYDITYAINNGYLDVTIKNSKNDIKIERYDKYGKLIKVTEDTTVVLENTYKEGLSQNTNASKLTNQSVSGINYTYKYDRYGNCNKVEEENYSENNGPYEYDPSTGSNLSYNFKLISDQHYDTDREEITRCDKIDNKLCYEKNILYSTFGEGHFNVTHKIEMDELNRQHQEKITNSYATISKEYEYKPISTSNFSGNTSNYLSTEKVNLNSTFIYSNQYTYGSVGIKEKTSNGIIEMYNYDIAKRIKQYSKAGMVVKTYSYDNDGNIYISGTTPVYENQLLTSFNGETIVYTNGYMTKYGNRNVLFENNRLMNYNNITFTYDGLGRRKTKTTSSGYTTNYYYQGNRLLKEEKSGNQSIDYIYGLNGLIGFVYQGVNYIYVKNALNDIERIYKENGELVAKYSYDPFGNTVIELNTYDIAVINPFRYRGYYYDNETGLFMVGHRYYNPEWGRWIQPDDIEYLDPTNINGLNLYAYCNNDPVNYFDPDGHSAVLLLSLIAVAGFGLTCVGAATDNSYWTAIGLTMVAIPALICGGLAAFGTAGLLSSIVGGATMFAGVVTGTFASAEYIEAAGRGNWIRDVTGMSEGWYDAAMIVTAGIATLGTIASSIIHAFDITSIDKIGKLTPKNHPNDGYYGVRYKTSRGSLNSLEIQNHPPHGFHFQRNVWNPETMKITSKAVHWTWYLTKF